MIFDHIVLSVSDLDRSRRFYEAILPWIGIDYIKVEETCVGFGINSKASFWICNDGAVQRPMHIAFPAKDHQSIIMFHQAGLLADGKCNGKPGFRKEYHPDYFGAFLLDPDGHNIEAVCRDKIPNSAKE